MIVRHRFDSCASSHAAERLRNLCGPVDQNLKLVEKALGVRITHRFEQFTLEGPQHAVQHALQILQHLYAMADESVSAEQLQLLLSTRWDAPPLVPAQAAGQTQATATSNMLITSAHGDILPRSKNQAAYLHVMTQHDLTLATGPAGTGKTFLAVAYALSLLSRHEVQRIILTRPAVEAGERLGFLPGDIAQKVDPYLRPLYDALYDLWGADKVAKAFERNQLEIAPLAFMRGRTLNSSFVILDEAQNATVAQMKMFLTRIGFGSKVVVAGDTTQVDLPQGQMSGLTDALQVLKSVVGVGHIAFGAQDVLRHPLVSRIVRAYAAAKPRPHLFATDRPPRNGGTGSLPPSHQG